jgi:hypothetical protein
MNSSLECEDMLTDYCHHFGGTYWLYLQGEILLYSEDLGISGEKIWNHIFINNVKLNLSLFLN